MAYFDGITASAFYKSDEGVKYFRPFGNWGKSYEVNDEQAAEVKEGLKKYYKLLFVLIFISGACSSLLYESFGMLKTMFIQTAVGLSIIYPIYFIWIRKLSKRLVAVNRIKVSIKVNTEAAAADMGYKTLIGLNILGLLMNAMCLFVLLDSDEPLVGAVGLAFFSLCQYRLIMMMKFNKKNS